MLKKSEHKTPGREPFRRQALLDFIRQNVKNGQWPPGEKLPPRSWFEREFQASAHTVQDAFAMLLEDGVLVTEGRRGTRVSLRPPHLFRYGIVLYSPENLFCRSLMLAAEQLRREDHRDIVAYVDLDLLVESDDRRKLLSDMERQTLAGLFFSAAPTWLRGTPILDLPGIPRTMAMHSRPPNGFIQNITTIDPLPTRIEDRMIFDELSTTGVRRAAFLIGAEDPCPEKAERIFRETASRGIECPPELLHFCNPHSPAYVESITRLIFSDANRLRPDGIYIGDDNFLPHAIRGIVAAMGEERARRITVLSQANVPMPERVDFPVRYFPMDTVRLLRRALAEIDRQRAAMIAAGAPVPTHTI